MKKLLASIGAVIIAAIAFIHGAPAAPGGLQPVTLAWDPNSEPDLAGYRIYYGTTELTNVANCGNVTQFPMKLGRGVWTFYATAYNTSGLESEPSNMVSWTNNTPGAPKLLRIR
jgi:hypothetical protein